MRAALAVIVAAAAATAWGVAAAVRDVTSSAPPTKAAGRGVSVTRRVPRRHAQPAVAALGASGADASREPAADDMRATCRVVGRVVGPGGAPVERAQVLVLDAFRTRLERDVADDGTFAESIQAGDAVRCVARASGRVAVTSAWATAEPGGTIDVGTLVLDVGESIRGRVCDERGEGVRSVSVDCTPADEDACERWRCAVEQSWSRADVTADDGSFDLRGLVPGRYRLSISPAGTCPWWSDGVIVDAGDQEVRLVLPGDKTPRCVVFSVRAESETGEPIPDFHANLSAWSESDGRSSEDGAACVALIETPPFRLTVSAPGFETATLDGVEGRPYSISVRLAEVGEAAAEREVTCLVELDGAPLPKGQWTDTNLVEVKEDGSSGDAVASLTVEGGAPFGLTPPRRGAYRVVANATVVRDGVKVVLRGRAEVTSGDRDVRVPLMPLTRIDGRVLLPDGLTPDELWVTVAEERRGGRVQTVTFEGTGGFSIGQLPPDSTYRVGVSVRSGREWMRGTVSVGIVAGGPPVEFRPERGLTIEGRVVRADGSPVPGARVWTFGERPHFRVAATGVDGRFRLTGLREGVERLQSDAAGLDMDGEPIPASAGATDVRLVLVPSLP